MAEIYAPAYLMAYGYARLDGATDQRAHLFARRFDQPTTVEALQERWQQFIAPADEPTGRPRCVCGYPRPCNCNR